MHDNSWYNIFKNRVWKQGYLYLLFDGDFAKNIDVNVEFYNVILAALCAIIIVLGMGYCWLHY